MIMRFVDDHPVFLRYSFAAMVAVMMMSDAIMAADWSTLAFCPFVSISQQPQTAPDLWVQIRMLGAVNHEPSSRASDAWYSSMAVS